MYINEENNFEERFIILTQDENVRKLAKLKLGVPCFYFSLMKIFAEEPSKLSIDYAEKVLQGFNKEWSREIFIARS